MIGLLQSANLALAFLLELALLAACALWGFETGDSTIVKLVLGIGAPLLVAVIWGILLAPNSSRRLKGAAYLGLKVVLFGLAVVALLAIDRLTLGVLLALIFAINTALAYAWHQEDASSPA